LAISNGTAIRGREQSARSFDPPTRGPLGPRPWNRQELPCAESSSDQTDRASRQRCWDNRRKGPAPAVTVAPVAIPSKSNFTPSIITNGKIAEAGRSIVKFF
jgi:hypothetical protein